MPKIAFNQSDLDAAKERAKVLDPAWYKAVITAPINVKSDKNGKPLYVAKVKLESGKEIFHNFSASGGGPNFWHDAIAASMEMDKQTYMQWIENQVKEKGEVDLEALLLGMAGKSVKVFLKLKDYQGTITNDIEKWAAIDASV